MKGRRRGLAVGLVLVLGLPAFAADRTPEGERNTGTTLARPPMPLDTKAMNAMLRADRDKDGTLSLEELDRYDLTLSPRFHDVDGDRDGRLTLYEFEKLLEEPQASARR